MKTLPFKKKHHENKPIMFKNVFFHNSYLNIKQNNSNK